jgi:uncharacterized protein with HEPN domain
LADDDIIWETVDKDLPVLKRLVSRWIDEKQHGATSET